MNSLCIPCFLTAGYVPVYKLTGEIHLLPDGMASLCPFLYNHKNILYIFCVYKRAVFSANYKK